MKKFSYYYEFYHQEIFDIDEMLEHKEQIEIAEKVENYLNSKNDNIDLIRSAIICSYKFEKKLDYEERLYFVRGILYSRQFMNENDLVNFSFDLSECDSEVLEKSLFEIRDFSDDYDREFFEDYLNNIKIIEEDITEDYLRNRIDALGVPISETEMVKTDEDEITVDEFFADSYEMKNLLPKERIDLFKEYYQYFKNGVLKNKNISKDNNPLEYEFVSKGMDAYNQFITGSFELMYEFSSEQFKRKSKNFLLSI